MIAPLGIAVAIWAVTGSAFALLFAFLGPVVALAGLVDSRLHTRRGRRAASERALAAVETIGAVVAARGQRERDRLAGLAPSLEVLVGRPSFIRYASTRGRIGTTWPDAEFVGGPYSPKMLLFCPAACVVLA